ncbi:hypothetical protein N0V84_003773, partial [Fusarium piperis]
NHPLNAQTFTALTYTWDTDEPSHNFLLNDKPIKIRNNLHAFLSQALPGSSSRLSCKVGPTRIDALCISQRDKAAQMASIYFAASRIVIWLRTEDQTSNTTMEFYARLTSHWANNQLPDQIIPLTGDEYSPARATGLEARCTKKLPRRPSTANSGSLLEPSPWNRRVSLLNELSDRRRATDRSDFLWLLMQAQGLEAHDPRDKIFPLLHVYADVRGKPISLEYDVEPEELYRSIAVLILNTTRAGLVAVVPSDSIRS